MTFPGCEAAGSRLGLRCPGGRATSDAPITLTAKPFQVAAGAEAVHVRGVRRIPSRASSTDIVKMHGGDEQAGSHPLLPLQHQARSTPWSSRPSARLDPVRGRGPGVSPPVFQYLSQQAVWDAAYPAAADGSPMGYPIVGTNELMEINAHSSSNAGAEAITASRPDHAVSGQGGRREDARRDSLPESDGRERADERYDGEASRLERDVDPGDSSLRLFASYNIFTSWQHMHRTALKFTASSNGSAFYTDTNWDSPALFYHASGMQEPSTATRDPERGPDDQHPGPSPAGLLVLQQHEQHPDLRGLRRSAT